MASESNHVRLRVPNDARWVGAVGAAVEHFADRAGFEAEGQRYLIAAVEQVCREAFPALPASSAGLDVTIQDFADRVEIVLEHSGDALRQAQFDPCAGAVGPASLCEMDRVQYQTVGQTSRVTMVKYVHPPRKNS